MMEYGYTAFGGLVAGFILCRLIYKDAISAYKIIQQNVKAGVKWIENLPSELRNKIKAAL